MKDNHFNICLSNENEFKPYPIQVIHTVSTIFVVNTFIMFRNDSVMHTQCTCWETTMKINENLA